MNFGYLIDALKRYLRTPWTAAAADVPNDELKQELEFHLMSSALDHHKSGLSIEDSQAVALESFGDLKAVLRDCGDVNSSGQRFWQRAHLVTTAVLVAAVGLLFVQQMQSDQPQAADVVAMAATGFSVEETSGDVEGQVHCPEGKAIPGANIVAVIKTWPEGGYRQQSYMTTTDPDGNFSIEDIYPPNQKYEVQVAVVAEDHLLTSTYTDMTTGILKPYDFELLPTNPFEIRFETEDGEPLQYVGVIPRSRTDADGNVHHVYSMGSQSLARHSNEQGTIPISQFSKGEPVAIAVQFPGEDWQVREIVVPDKDQVVVMTPMAL